MANHNKFDIKKYIHCGFSSYEEYKEVAAKLGRAVHEMVIDDAYEYLDLIESGYNFILEDVQDILDISNRNTIQTKIMKDIDKMYINKAVKDLLYLATGKVYRLGLSDSAKEIGVDDAYLKEFEKELLDKCKKLNLRPSFLIKRTFMKESDVKEAIRKIFKKEQIEDGVKHYVEITEEEINLIMKNGLKSDKTIRNELGLSNLNQIQRRISKGTLDGYIGRFALISEESKVPLVRYLFDTNTSKDENNKE